MSLLSEPLSPKRCVDTFIRTDDIRSGRGLNRKEAVLQHLPGVLMEKELRRVSGKLGLLNSRFVQVVVTRTSGVPQSHSSFFIYNHTGL